jgi:hypothetical protein
MATNNAVIKVSAEDKTKTAFNKIQRNLKKLKETSQRVSSTLAGMVGVGGLGLVSNQMLKTADSIGKTSDKLGISTTKFQTLSNVAQESGMEVNQFAMAFQRFTRRTEEASRGTGEANDAIKMLGIELFDQEGALRTADKLLMDVADRFKELGPGAERVSTAFKLFDSEGVKMVNMIQNGSKAIEEAQQKYEDAGAYIGGDFIRNAEDANDEFLMYSKTISGNFSEGLGVVLPQLIGITKSLAGMKDKFIMAGKGLNFLTMGFRVLVTVVDYVIDQLSTGLVDGFEILGLKVKAFWQSLNTARGGTSIDLITELEKKTADWNTELAQTQIAYANNLQAIQSQYEAHLTSLEASEKTLEIEEDTLEVAGETQKKKYENIAIGKQQIKLMLENAKFESTMESNRRKAFEDYKKNLAEKISLIKKEPESLMEQLEANEAIRMQERQMILDGLDVEAVEKDEARRADVASFERYEKAKREMVVETASSNIATLASMSSSVKDESQALFQFWKATAIAEATMNAYQAITKALATLPPPWSFAMAGAVGTLAFAQVAKIAQTNPVKKYVGGDVTAGNQYMVGERGPELLQMGKMGGSITPNNKLPKATVVNINISAVDAKGIDALLTQKKGFIVGLINQSLNRQTRQAI